MLAPCACPDPSCRSCAVMSRHQRWCVTSNGASCASLPQRCDNRTTTPDRSSAARRLTSRHAVLCRVTSCRAVAGDGCHRRASCVSAAPTVSPDHPADRTGQDRTGRIRQGRQERTGQDPDSVGQDRTGQDRTGQDRTGPDRTGHTGQDCTGHHIQDRTDRIDSV